MTAGAQAKRRGEESTTKTGRSPASLPDPPGTYELMYRLRRFEERAYELFLQNHIHGTMHLGLGQEAVAAGVAAALKHGDYSLSTYRGHNHVIARGAPLDASMAELFGRGTGLCKGKGGSMHLTSVEHGALGSYAIVGAHLPVACGTGWSAKVRGTDQVTACFFGDGTTNIGAFHEALNLAAVWKLPVLFICENNLYMEFTPIAAVTAVTQPAADRASAYGMEPITVDGNDVEAVYDVAKQAVDRARAGKGPSLIEALTYRYSGHSRTDPGKYRPENELEEWKQRDAVAGFRKRLAELGTGEDWISQIERETEAELETAIQRALEAPIPEAAEAYTDVYCHESQSWRN
jgi:acetoin:2,6-dichlorophenolindophenol oxidoreductase subunit alpha